MSYRWVFDKDDLVRTEDVRGEKMLVVYSEAALVLEPVGMLPQKTMMMLVNIHDGIDRPYVQVTTNKTVDLAVDSKDATMEAVEGGSYWKFHIEDEV